jgi:hypothetical protein
MQNTGIKFMNITVFRDVTSRTLIQTNLICLPQTTQQAYLSTYFAFSNPVPPNGNFDWEPTSPNSKDLEYLYIGTPNKLEMRSTNNLGEQQFWDSLPINEPQIGKNTPLRKEHTEF